MLRVGIVGSGFMAKTHAHAWGKTPAQVTSIVSTDSAEATLLAASVSAKVMTSLAEMLPSVDVVDICTPTHLHYDMVLEAAAAGKHVVCEKPLARTARQAQAMLQAVDQAGVMLLVGHVVRFFPEYNRAKAIVHSGSIGEVAVTRLTRCSFKPARNHPESWFHDEAKSGGMMLDLMVHDFDFARWIAGDVVSVYAKRISKAFDYVPGDYALAILTHRSGAISHVEGGWVYPVPMFRTTLEIAGSRGLIEHPSGGSIPLSFYLHSEAHSDADIAVPSSPLLHDPYEVQIHHFYDVLSRPDISPRITGADAYEALCIALAAIESAQSGQVVMIDDIKRGA